MRSTVSVAALAFLLWGVPQFATGDINDIDADGILDPIDNCSQAANPAQGDTDLDDCGNLCDADYDNDGIVGILDFGLFSVAYLHICLQISCVECVCEMCHRDVPLVGCSVGILDFGFFGGAYRSTPGPSGTTAGTVACP